MTEKHLDAEDLRLVEMETKCIVCGKKRGAHFSYYNDSANMITYCDPKNTDEWKSFRVFIPKLATEKDENPNALFQGEV